jgi:hypothetical protein
LSVTARQKIARRSTAKYGRIGPHSRLFRAGAKGRLDGRSVEARYLRDAEAQLTAHVGNPSVVERVLISRLARIVLRLTILDDKVARGEGTDYDVKVIGGLDSALRNGLSRLGLKSASSERAPIDPHLAALTPRQREEAT